MSTSFGLVLPPRRATLLLGFVVAVLCTSCEPSGALPGTRDAEAFSVPSDTFGAYWYRGLAEVTTYKLEQARYGDMHPGTATLIYVTEPFLKLEQVKANRADDGNTLTVLKLNAVRKFTTGIYPYSMMQSVFTPVPRDRGRMPLKVSASSQEWCGHTYTQINRTGDGYRARLFSYFEGETDLENMLPNVMLEDGLWTLLRLNPRALPTGEFRLVPGTIYQRLSHTAIEAYDATATLEAHADSAGLSTYAVTYPALDRTLRIHFQTSFPHAIEAWEDTYLSGSGPDAKLMTTRATKMARETTAYWQRNTPRDSTLRRQLMLE